MDNVNVIKKLAGHIALNSAVFHLAGGIHLFPQPGNKINSYEQRLSFKTSA